MLPNEYLPWIGVAGSTLQLLGGLLTLWGLLSATTGRWQLTRALVGALWRSSRSRLFAELSELNKADPVRVLQGVAVFTLGYILALVSQVSAILACP